MYGSLRARCNNYCVNCMEVYAQAERCIRRPASSRLSFTVVYTSYAEFKVLISQRINIYLKILYNTQANASEVILHDGECKNGLSPKWKYFILM